MRSQGPSSPQSAGCHEFCTLRNTRSGCGISTVNLPSGVVRPVMPASRRRASRVFCLCSISAAGGTPPAHVPVEGRKTLAGDAASAESLEPHATSAGVPVEARETPNATHLAPLRRGAPGAGRRGPVIPSAEAGLNHRLISRVPPGQTGDIDRLDIESHPDARLKTFAGISGRFRMIL